MKKIKIRDTSAVTSIANVLFSIEKGKIISLPDDFKVDESVFQVVEDSSGNKVTDEHIISEKEVKNILDIHNFSNFKQKVQELKLNNESLLKLQSFEKFGKKRKDWMNYFALTIVKPADDGTKITEEGMLARELMSVKGINDELANRIVEKYKTREEIISKLSNNKQDIENLKGITHEILQELLKHFKIEKSRVTTKKTMFGG